MDSFSIEKYKKYIGGSILAVIVFLAVGYFVYKNIVPTISPQKNIPGQNVDLSSAPVVFNGQPAPKKPLDFKGTLYLSLKKINGI